VLGGDQLPEPPERLPAAFDLAEEQLSAWHLHREENPLEVRRYPTGRYRFDAPSGEYATLYCNTIRLAVFAEVYGDVRVIEATEKRKRLSHTISEKDLYLVLEHEFRAALDAIGPDIEKRIEGAEREVLALEHADPSSSLTTDELEAANARRAFVTDEVFGMSAEALAERFRAVLASGDRPAMFLYAHHARVKTNDPVFGDDSETLRLKELAGELEGGLDPERARKTEAARVALREAREIKSYAYYRRHGARDAVEMHMNRVYSRTAV